MVIQLSPVTRPPYPHTGQGHDRRLRRRRGARSRATLWRLEGTVGTIALVVVTIVLTTWPGAAPARSMPAGLTLARFRTGVGRPVRRPSVPNRQLLDHYVFNGSAAPGFGWVNGTGRGLDVGVRPHAGWAGWFAVTLTAAGPDVVWHAVMSRPTAAVGSGVGEAVLAVQSASTQRNGTINYVVVSSLSSRGKSTWQVGSAHGYRRRRSHRSAVAGAPPHRRPAQRTDHRCNRRAPQFDGVVRRPVVYSSHHLHMNDPAPFQAYLEVQGRGIGYVSTFKDFWVADAAPVTVEGSGRGHRRAPHRPRRRDRRRRRRRAGDVAGSLPGIGRHRHAVRG